MLQRIGLQNDMLLIVVHLFVRCFLPLGGFAFAGLWMSCLFPTPETGACPTERSGPPAPPAAWACPRCRISPRAREAMRAEQVSSDDPLDRALPMKPGWLSGAYPIGSTSTRYDGFRIEELDCPIQPSKPHDIKAAVITCSS